MRRPLAGVGEDMIHHLREPTLAVHAPVCVLILAEHPPRGLVRHLAVDAHLPRAGAGPSLDVQFEPRHQGVVHAVRVEIRDIIVAEGGYLLGSRPALGP